MLPRESKIGLGGDTLPVTPGHERHGHVSQFIESTFQHFNAATVKDAADGWLKQLLNGGGMFLSMAGAMSTGEIGITLAELIRQRRVSGISCTGANLEEDLFNLVAHDDYVRVPHYRDLTPADEQALMKTHLNRVTDTAIPEKAAMTVIEKKVISRWEAADKSGRRALPHEFLYDLIRSGELKPHYQIDPANSWMLAAAEVDLPIFVPGWEDSTLGNVYAACCLRGEIKHPTTVRGGIEYMMELAAWYLKTTRDRTLGFFQIGGGIAGDFSICVVPLLQQDYGLKKTPFWNYFCQITDAVESYGGYSGAAAAEKITWGKIEPDTPTYMIQSDASIVFPLIAARVLGW